MTANLSREFLWTDLNTMDEFFRLDPVNEVFFDTFVTLREKPFGVKLDAVKVFNEVYYTVTRFYYEQAFGSDVPNYASDIKADLGWNYSAELVLSMAYWLTEIAQEKMRVLFRVNLRDMCHTGDRIICDMAASDLRRIFIGGRGLEGLYYLFI